jgi:hypothetical protein
MIACVSPSSHSLSETQSTLRYAQRAKHIKSIPLIKTSDPQEEVITRLKRDLKLAKAAMSQVRENIVRKGRGAASSRSYMGMAVPSRVVTGNTANQAPRIDMMLNDYNQQNAQSNSGQGQYEGGSYEYPQSRHQSQDFLDYSYGEFENMHSGDTNFSSEDSFYVYAHPKVPSKSKLTTEKKKVTDAPTKSKNTRPKR